MHFLNIYHEGGENCRKVVMLSHLVVFCETSFIVIVTKKILKWQKQFFLEEFLKEIFLKISLQVSSFFCALWNFF